MSVLKDGSGGVAARKRARARDSARASLVMTFGSNIGFDMSPSWYGARLAAITSMDTVIFCSTQPRKESDCGNTKLVIRDGVSLRP